MVGIIAYSIGEHMKLSDKEKEELLIAGYMHDLGKAIISHEYLEREDKLTTAEHNDFKKYPSESVRIMKTLGYESESLLNMVEYHRELFNGTGYPTGMIGESIPIGARILSIADAFDTMTSKRLHAETWEYKSALREIQKDADNGLYDLNCVSALKELFDVT
jgi:HD-GYP domain-containing protein (c-di-GMP phosphodiesterase class II)